MDGEGTLKTISDDAGVILLVDALIKQMTIDIYVESTYAAHDQTLPDVLLPTRHEKSQPEVLSTCADEDQTLPEVLSIGADEDQTLPKVIATASQENAMLKVLSTGVAHDQTMAEVIATGSQDNVPEVMLTDYGSQSSYDEESIIQMQFADNNSDEDAEKEEAKNKVRRFVELKKSLQEDDQTGANEAATENENDEGGATDHGLDGSNVRPGHDYGKESTVNAQNDAIPTIDPTNTASAGQTSQKGKAAPREKGKKPAVPPKRKKKFLASTRGPHHIFKNTPMLPNEILKDISETKIISRIGLRTKCHKGTVLIKHPHHDYSQMLETNAQNSYGVYGLEANDYDVKTLNWFLLLGEQEIIGYWPKEIFNNLVDSSDVEVAGYINSPLNENSPPMGNGIFPNPDPSKACELKHIKLLNENGDFIVLGSDTTYTLLNDLPDYYGVVIEHGVDDFSLSVGGPGGSVWKFGILLPALESCRLSGVLSPWFEEELGVQTKGVDEEKHPLQFE
ncbi:hypothetical protein J5N97_030004 [Dioscorea zingiberensis]|uniref:Neprosin PEP catalytic domain-containing protein n=1 Tax=Dioscorea zingiberensis TaxID=325984 RepID=A0A9D5H3U9_9LILI|nr:hypothetical protein J5N97_030004 [Dioscorea zingiberensis]